MKLLHNTKAIHDIEQRRVDAEQRRVEQRRLDKRRIVKSWRFSEDIALMSINLEPESSESFSDPCRESEIQSELPNEGSDILINVDVIPKVVIHKAPKRQERPCRVRDQENRLKRG